MGKISPLARRPQNSNCCGTPARALAIARLDLEQVVLSGRGEERRRVAEESLARMAVHPHRAVVDVEKATLAVLDIDGVRDALEEAAVAALGLAQRALGALALREVEDRHGPRRAPGEAHLVRADLDLQDVAVLPAVAPFARRAEGLWAVSREVRAGEADPLRGGCRGSSWPETRRASSRRARPRRRSPRGTAASPSRRPTSAAGWFRRAAGSASVLAVSSASICLSPVMSVQLPTTSASSRRRWIGADPGSRSSGRRDGGSGSRPKRGRRRGAPAGAPAGGGGRRGGGAAPTSPAASASSVE